MNAAIRPFLKFMPDQPEEAPQKSSFSSRNSNSQKKHHSQVAVAATPGSWAAASLATRGLRAVRMRCFVWSGGQASCWRSQRTSPSPTGQPLKLQPALAGASQPNTLLIALTLTNVGIKLAVAKLLNFGAVYVVSLSDITSLCVKWPQQIDLVSITHKHIVVKCCRFTCVFLLLPEFGMGEVNSDGRS